MALGSPPVGGEGAGLAAMHSEGPRALAGSPPFQKQSASRYFLHPTVQLRSVAEGEKGGAKNTLRIGRTFRVTRPEAVGLEGTKCALTPLSPLILMTMPKLPSSLSFRMDQQCEQR